MMLVGGGVGGDPRRVGARIACGLEKAYSIGDVCGGHQEVVVAGASAAGAVVEPSVKGNAFKGEHRNASVAEGLEKGAQAVGLVQAGADEGLGARFQSGA
jgi:hypothetical protein